MPPPEQTESPVAGEPPAVEAHADPSILAIVPVAPTKEGRTPHPLPDDPRWAEAEALLEPVVERYTRDPDNPWAIAHGYLVHGTDFTLSNGELAVTYLYARYANLDARGLVDFPASDGNIRIEPHPDLLLKSIAEAGFDPTFHVQVDGKDTTLADHYRGVLDHTVFDPTSRKSSFPKPNDMPWAVQAIAAWAPSKPMAWTGSAGVRTSLDDLASTTVAVLVSETRFLGEAKKSGQRFERKGQGIFTYTCGGAHLLQGAAYAVARGYGRPTDRAAIQEQVELHFYRYPIERDITIQAMKDFPEHEQKLLVQRLKFSGHFLESMHKLAALGFYAPTPEQDRLLERAAADVWEVAKLLEAKGMLGDLSTIRASDEQLYLDIVGDSAHALKGLRLARGQAAIRY